MRTEPDAFLITPSIGRSYHQDEVRVHADGYELGIVVALARSIRGEFQEQLSTELTALEARSLAALLVLHADFIDRREGR